MESLGLSFHLSHYAALLSSGIDASAELFLILTHNPKKLGVIYRLNEEWWKRSPWEVHVFNSPVTLNLHHTSVNPHVDMFYTLGLEGQGVSTRHSSASHCLSEATRSAAYWLMKPRLALFPAITAGQRFKTQTLL